MAQNADSDNEFLTDFEKQQREQLGLLQKEIETVKGESEAIKASHALMHFNSLQQKHSERWGTILDEYTPKVMEAVKGLSKTMKDPSQINEAFLESLYIQQVPYEERPAVYAALAQRDAERKAQNQQSRGTTVPSQQRQDSVDETPPKTLAESWARGKRDAEARAARG